MSKLLKFLFFLVVLAGVGFVVFAYLGPLVLPEEFAAPQNTETQSIILFAE